MPGAASSAFLWQIFCFCKLIRSTGPLLGVQKANVFAAPKMRLPAVSLFVKNGAALPKKEYFYKRNGMAIPNFAATLLAGCFFCVCVCTAQFCFGL